MAKVKNHLNTIQSILNDCYERDSNGDGQLRLSAASYSTGTENDGNDNVQSIFNDVYKRDASNNGVLRASIN